MHIGKVELQGQKLPISRNARARRKIFTVNHLKSKNSVIEDAIHLQNQITKLINSVESDELFHNPLKDPHKWNTTRTLLYEKNQHFSAVSNSCEEPIQRNRVETATDP